MADDGKSEAPAQSTEGESVTTEDSGDAVKMTPMQQRLFQLRLKANEARAKNREALRTEAQRKTEPQMSEAQRLRAQKAMRAEKAREEAIKEGRDPKLCVLEVTAEKAAREARKKRGKGASSDDEDGEDSAKGGGWSVFDEDCQARVYKRRVKAIESRGDAVREEYAAQKARLGSDVYASTDSLTYGTDPHAPAENVARMTGELAQTVARRSQFSRRRPVYEEGAVNERNRQFNRKIARAYDPYTADTKASLERGTAV